MVSICALVLCSDLTTFLLISAFGPCNQHSAAGIAKMPPKGRAAAKAKSGTVRNSAPRLQPLLTSQTLDSQKMSAGARNAMVVEALMKDVEIILSVPELADIKTEDPLQIQRVTNSHESGHAEPFNARQGAIALKSTNKYDAGMNYGWQDFEWMAKCH